MRIQDVLEAVSKIQAYTAGMDFAVFRNDSRTVDAVVRNFAIIGEAVTYLPPEIIAKHPEIPWKVMRGMRNVMVHEYFGVSLPILWETVQKDLAPLVPQLEKLLQDEP